MKPFFDLFGIKISAYGLCLILGVFLVAFFAYLKGKKRNVPSENIILITAFVIGSALIGGKLLFLFVTYPVSNMIKWMSDGKFEFLINGGIVFYGGLIGGLAGGLLGKKLIDTDMKTLELLFVPFVPLGHAIGRIGCLMAGCCHGMEYEGALAVYYKNSLTNLPPEQGYFPVQPLEAVLDVFICIYLLYYSRKERKKFDVLFTYLLLYAIMRMFTECFRGDSIRGIYFGLSTSQWISAGIIFIYFTRMIWKKFKENNC